MEVVPGLGEERRDVAGRALPSAVEDFFAAPGRCRIETALGRRRRRDGELVEVQRPQLRGDQVGGAAYIEGAASRRDRVLSLGRLWAPQAQVEEDARAVLLGHGDIGD